MDPFTQPHVGRFYDVDEFEQLFNNMTSDPNHAASAAPMTQNYHGQPSQSAYRAIFNADINQAAGFDVHHPQVPIGVSFNQDVFQNGTTGNTGFDDVPSPGTNMASLNSPGNHAFPMPGNFQSFTFSNPTHARLGSSTSEVQSDQLAANESTNDLLARLEAAVPRQPTQAQSDAGQLRDQDSGSPGGDSQNTTSGAEETWGTPGSSDGSFSTMQHAARPDQSISHPSIRRTSATTAELSDNIANVNLQQQETLRQMYSQTALPGTFAKPRVPHSQQVLAERRNQRKPNALSLGRTVSSSAVPQLSDGRYSSPHAQLRHAKSAILGTHITNSHVSKKSRQNSHRGSPMLASFAESVLHSAQATPQPPTAIIAHSQLSSPPSQQFWEAQHDALPTSASTSVFTPGMPTGSMSGHSFANTPVTTPYSSQHDVPYRPYGFGPPPSDVPQSAPAHMSSFEPSEMSPRHGLPSMPVTPHNPQFPPQHPQLQMWQGSMMQQQRHVVPSQHGNPDPAAYVHRYSQDFSPAQYSHHLQGYDGNLPFDLYSAHDEWRYQYALRPHATPIEIKVDDQTLHLNEGIRNGTVTLLPQTQTYRETTFNNLSVADLKADQARKA